MKIDISIAPQIVEINAKPQTAEIVLGNPVFTDHTDTEPYAGPYEVTPTQSTQVLATEDLRMVQNVTVNPIPSNYGMISWDGSVLTVS